MVDVRGAEQPANAWAFDPAKNASAEVGFAHRSHSAGGAGPSDGPACDDDWLAPLPARGFRPAWRWLYDQQFERVYRLVQRLGVPERDAPTSARRCSCACTAGWGASAATPRSAPGCSASPSMKRAAGAGCARSSQALLALYSRGRNPALASRTTCWPGPKAGASWPRLLDQLKPKLREVFVLFEIEELSLDQVSAVLNVGAETVKSRIKRARSEFERLRKQRALVAVAGGAGRRP